MSITDTAYLERNAKGFEADFFLKQEIERLIKKHSIELVIETGSYRGYTTRQFAAMAPEVITTEANPEYYRETLDTIAGLTNVKAYFGKTEEVLPHLLDKYQLQKKILFFLDDHWLENLPLLDELHIIASVGLKPVIVIHDFKVPGKTFGYDTYNGQPLNYAYVEEALIKIYGVHFSHHYNDRAAGAARGVLYCEPI